MASAKNIAGSSTEEAPGMELVASAVPASPSGEKGPPAMTFDAPLENEKSSAEEGLRINLSDILSGDAVSLREQITQFLEAWKIAWEGSAGKNGDIDKYIAYYSDTYFTEKNFYTDPHSSKQYDKNVWREMKRRRNNAKEWIQVEMQDVEIICSANSRFAVVQFRQQYSSSNYSDNVFKTLILYREDNGWKIVSENAL